jgi:hypothetical protein
VRRVAPIGDIAVPVHAVARIKVEPCCVAVSRRVDADLRVEWHDCDFDGVLVGGRALKGRQQVKGGALQLVDLPLTLDRFLHRSGVVEDERQLDVFRAPRDLCR